MESEHQIYRTKLANQRTYLAYLRTGFAIAVLAKVYDKIYILYFGIILLIASTIQYLMAINSIDNNNLDNEMGYYIDRMPVFYGMIAIFALYLQFYKNKIIHL
jgi:uncharacterized membrane protein YidH (DUF202 family)